MDQSFNFIFAINTKILLMENAFPSKDTIMLIIF